MSQAQTDISGLRMVFEGVPEDLLESIGRIENEMDRAEKSIVQSADNAEKAIGRSAKKQADSVSKSADVQKKVIKDIQQSLGDQGDGYATAATSAETSSARTQGSLGKLGDEVERRTEGFRKFSGAVSGAIGMVTGLVGVGTLLIGVLAGIGRAMLEKAKKIGEANRAYADMRDEINGLMRMDAPNVFADITAEVDALADAVTASNVSSEQQSELFEKLVVHEKQLRKETVKNIEAQERRTKAIKNRDALNALREMRSAMRDAAITDPELRALEDYHKILSDIEKLEIDAGLAGGVAARGARQQAEENHKLRMDQIAAENDARVQADLAAANRAQQAHNTELQRIEDRERKAVQSNTRIITQASNDLNGSIGEEVTRLLSTIVRKVDKAGRCGHRIECE